MGARSVKIKTTDTSVSKESGRYMTKNNSETRRPKENKLQETKAQSSFSEGSEKSLWKKIKTYMCTKFKHSKYVVKNETQIAETSDSKQTKCPIQERSCTSAELSYKIQMKLQYENDLHFDLMTKTLKTNNIIIPTGHSCRSSVTHKLFDRDTCTTKTSESSAIDNSKNSLNFENQSGVIEFTQKNIHVETFTPSLPRAANLKTFQILNNDKVGYEQYNALSLALESLLDDKPSYVTSHNDEDTELKKCYTCERHCMEQETELTQITTEDVANKLDSLEIRNRNKEIDTIVQQTETSHMCVYDKKTSEIKDNNFGNGDNKNESNFQCKNLQFTNQSDKLDNKEVLPITTEAHTEFFVHELNPGRQSRYSQNSERYFLNDDIHHSYQNVPVRPELGSFSPIAYEVNLDQTDVSQIRAPDHYEERTDPKTSAEAITTLTNDELVKVSVRHGTVSDETVRISKTGKSLSVSVYDAGADKMKLSTTVTSDWPGKMNGQGCTPDERKNEKETIQPISMGVYQEIICINADKNKFREEGNGNICYQSKSSENMLNITTKTLNQSEDGPADQGSKARKHMRKEGIHGSQISTPANFCQAVSCQDIDRSVFLPHENGRCIPENNLHRKSKTTENSLKTTVQREKQLVTGDENMKSYYRKHSSPPKHQPRKGNTNIKSSKVRSGELSMKKFQCQVVSSYDSGYSSFLTSNRSLILTEIEGVQNSTSDRSRYTRKQRSGRVHNLARTEQDFIKYTKRFITDALNNIANNVVVFPGLHSYFDCLRNGVTPSQEQRMAYEWLRLMSFSTYTGRGFAVHLARSGFYHRHGNQTRCFCCQVTYSDWNFTDNVQDVHRRISPNCPFVNGGIEYYENISVDNGTRESHVNQHDRHNPSQTSSNVASVQTAHNRERTPIQTNGCTVSLRTISSRTLEQTPSPLRPTPPAQPTPTVVESALENPTVEPTQQLNRLRLTEDVVSGRNISNEPAERENSPHQLLQNHARNLNGQSTVQNANEHTDRSGALIILPSVVTPQSTEVPASVNPYILPTPSMQITTNADDYAVVARRNIANEQVELENSPHQLLQNHARNLNGQSTVHNENQRICCSDDSIYTSVVTPQSTDVPVSVSPVIRPTLSVHTAANADESSQRPPAARTESRDILQIGNLKDPRYRTMPVRIKSFVGWPNHSAQTPRAMACAGFYYKGLRDCVRCFCCGGDLYDWEANDDPIVEHARHFPECEYINMIKGTQFVKDVCRKYKEQMTEKRTEHQASENTRTNRRDRDQQRPKRLRNAIPLIDSLISVDVISESEGPTSGSIESTSESYGATGGEEEQIETNLRRGRQSQFSTDIPQNCFDDSSKDIKDTRSKREAKLPRQTQVCTVCMTPCVRVILLPCSHLEICEKCARCIKKCPICGRKIKQRP